jgi:hypothetical protein
MRKVNPQKLLAFVTKIEELEELEARNATDPQ